MAKLTILIALVAALVLVVHTSAFRSSEQICKSQIQQVNLKHCENHITQRIQQQQEEEEENHARSLRRMKHSILRRHRSGEESEELEQCCENLNEIYSETCQCRALQQIYESQSEQCEGKQQEQQLEQEIQKLPETCGFRPIRWCNVNPEDQQ